MGHRTSAAQTIYSNLSTKIVLPGVSVRRDLADLAYLAGHREVSQSSEQYHRDDDRAQSRTISRTRQAVIAGDMIYRLPLWHVSVLGLGPRPAVGRFVPGYRTVRRHRRGGGQR